MQADKKGRPKKGEKNTEPAGKQKKKKGERASPSRGRKLSHPRPL